MTVFILLVSDYTEASRTYTCRLLQQNQSPKAAGAGKRETSWVKMFRQKYTLKLLRINCTPSALSSTNYVLIRGRF